MYEDNDGDKERHVADHHNAFSQVAAHDSYELRIVVPHGNASWHMTRVTLSPDDVAAGVTTEFSQDGARVRVTLTGETSRKVAWTAVFEPAVSKRQRPGR